jgi:hypothetical protein
MRPILFLAAAVAVFSAAYYMTQPEMLEAQDLDISKDFIEFITSYGKQYVDQSEFSRRYSLFRKTLIEI